MWFKNLIVYRLLDTFGQTPESLAEAMEAHAFRPCGGLEPFTSGWDVPTGRLGTELVHAANNAILVCMRREERLLPASVVREELAERIARIEDTENRTVRRKEQQRLRDEVIFEFLPRAFTRSQRTFAYIEPRHGWLVVDTPSARRAEELLILLGESLVRLDAEPFATESSPAAVMTRWLSDAGPPAGLELLEECELRDPDEEGAQVRCRRQDLHSSEIRAHLQARKQVRQLALRFDERVSFVLDADLTVRRLRFEAASEPGDNEYEDELARFDADFAYMTAEVNALIAKLASVFE